MKTFIFFDVDGILNQLQRWYIDENCIKVLADLCKKYDARLILISSWRFGFCYNRKNCSLQVKDLISKLEKYNLRILGRTDDFNDRRVEVDNFVKSHNIENYIILDDDKSLYSSYENLYLVNSKTGLTYNDYKRITKEYVFD